MRASFTILLFLMITNSFAQSGKLYKGTIGKNLKITFYLQGMDEGTNADAILGSYKYDNSKQYILLNGYRNNAGNISLAEQATANFSGTFLGTLNGPNIAGKWISADQKTTYTFVLTQVVVNTAEISLFRQAITDKGAEFRNY